MKTSLLIVATALALGTLAGCDRNPTPPQTGSAAGGSSAAPSAAQSNTPSTPANAGTPSEADKAHGANPQQGQVDPKQSAQHKDFQQRGDGAGPQNPAGR